MASLPVRRLGDAGVITDVNPYDLPANAYSDANNVIFDDGKVLRAPAFKKLFDQIAVTPVGWSSQSGTYANSAYTWSGALAASQVTTPRNVASYRHPSNGPVVIVTNQDGNVFDYAGGTLSVLTPSAVNTGSSYNTPWTHTEISGLSVLNRNNSTPYIRDTVSGTIYSLMTVGDWPSSTYAVSMRSFKDFLIAMNVTEGGTQNNSKVKWTDPIQYRASLSTGVVWTSSSSNSAGDNVLGQAKSPIQDGMAVGNVFVIYTQTEAFLMEFTGSSLVFSFRELFSDDGVIGLNCIATAGQTQYVFGNKDIYITNGATKQSIADGKVRRKIYKELDTSKTDRCFVHHDTALDLIYFSYVTRDSEAGYAGSTYANRAAVYNTKNQTWSFMDLPNIVGAAIANLTTTDIGYNDYSATYSASSSSYNNFASKTAETTVMVGAKDTSLNLSVSRIYAVELLNASAFAIDQEVETIKTAYVERMGLDVDETQAPLRSMKSLKSIAPQIYMADNTYNVTVKVGFTDLPAEEAVTYQTSQTFTPLTDHKVDSRASGRLLAYRVEETNGNFFNMSGADFDVSITGKR